MVNIIFTVLFAAGAAVAMAGTAWLTESLPPQIAELLPPPPKADNLGARSVSKTAEPNPPATRALAGAGGSLIAPQPSRRAAETGPGPQPDADGPTFDIAQVSPVGGAVFAGRSTPGSKVTVAANGREVATVVTDANGEWIATSDAPMAAGDVELTLQVKAAGTGAPLAGQSLRRVVAAPPPAAASGLATAALPASVKPLGGERGIRVASAPTPSSTSASTSGVVIRSGEGAAAATSNIRPITFVTGEATLTPQGRIAATELARLLIASRPEGVTLSGHADERGGDGFNMELSRRRLNAIGRLIREQGFSGDLVLVPKGESEPYAAVDRNRMPRRDLWQLDRRVEVQLGSVQR